MKKSRVIAIMAGLLCSACVAIPVASDSRYCAGGTCHEPRLVVGLFPTVGEAHLNRRATNRKPLTMTLRIFDYTLRPLAISAINLISLGIPTGLSLVLEPYEGWDDEQGPCRGAVIGYCKASRIR